MDRNVQKLRGLGAKAARNLIAAGPKTKPMTNWDLAKDLFGFCRDHVDFGWDSKKGRIRNALTSAKEFYQGVRMGMAISSEKEMNQGYLMLLSQATEKAMREQAEWNKSELNG